MKRVLLTGATGFVGRQAIEPLRERGFEVHAVTSRPGQAARPGVVWHEVDLLAPDAPRRIVEEVVPTHLLHLAWYAEPGRFWTSPENERWLEASVDLVRAFADAGGRRAVAAGTCAEYDWSVGGALREGATPVRPSTVYGQAKAAFAARAQELVPTLGWGRIFFLFGPGEHPARLVSSVAGALLEGRPAPCSHGRQVRDFLHCADVAAAFAGLLDSAVAGPVNIASGEPVTIAELVGLIGEATGRPELIELGALPERPDEPPVLLAEVARLRDEVGFAPRLTLSEGIAATVEWWRRELGAR
ncbi:MAG: hypothetical protein QOF77_1699 [Solirubrobacteraceae bacterium]|jgi:nucleoside-diphosphate-sugar epimerase|nr:hypothetical protein [Solirubrobacteraceae bacterium]